MVLTRAKNPVVLKGIGEFDIGYISVSKLRSYLLDDPFTDLAKEKLGITYGPQSIFATQGIKFEDNIVQHLVDTYGDDVKVFTKYNDYDGPIDAINKGIPILVQAPLKDDDWKIRGIADLVVKIGFMSKIFKNVQIPLCDPEKYCVIDIKFSKVPVLKNGFVGNSGNFKYYKYQTTLYNKMLSKIQNCNVPISYIMGKYIDGSDIKDPFYQLGIVGNQSQDLEKVKDTLKHLEHVKQFHSMYSFDDLPKRYLPNRLVTSYVPEIEKLKMDIIKNDVTILPYCGVNKRELVNYKQWNDEAFDVKDLRMSEKLTNHIDRLVKIQKGDELFNCSISECGLELDNAIFMDFETIPNIVNTDPFTQGDSISDFVFMLGAYHNDEFTGFTAKNYSLKGERRILKKFLRYCKKKDYPKIVYYNADKSFYSKMLERQDLDDKYKKMAREIQYNWIDLHSYLKDIGFVAKGLFDLKLKIYVLY